MLLIDKIESVIKRMRWKAYFLWKIKWLYHPSQSNYLEAFENDLFNMANPLKFRPVHNDFQP